MNEPTADAFLGTWAGRFDAEGAPGDRPAFIELTVSAGADGLRAVLDMAGRRDAADNVSTRFGRLRLDMAGGYLQGALEDDTLAGTLDVGRERGAFRLLRLHPDPATPYDRYAGLYDFPEGHTVLIRQREGGSYPLETLDFASGASRVLFPQSNARFLTGPEFFLPYPPQAALTFVRDVHAGRMSLTWEAEGQRASALRRDPFRREDLRFSNGDVSLAGTLILPPGAGPFPCAVFIHGTGVAERFTNHYAGLPLYFAAQGVAAFVYDKRGGGESGGDWRTARFPDLAGDALAAVAMLKARRDLRDEATGLWGVSQGGWLAPLAASLSDDVAFVIAVSAPGVSPAALEANRIAHQLRVEGFGQAAITAALALQQQAADSRRTGEGIDALRAVIAAAEDEDWFPWVGVPRAARLHDSPPEIGDLDHDPVPVLEALRCPLLALWGALDTYVPVEASRAAFAAALKRGGNPDYTLKVFEGGDHGLWITTPERGEGWPYSPGYVPGYLATMRDWLLAHV